MEFEHRPLYDLKTHEFTTNYEILGIKCGYRGKHILSPWFMLRVKFIPEGNYGGIFLNKEKAIKYSLKYGWLNEPPDNFDCIELK